MDAAEGRGRLAALGLAQRDIEALLDHFLDCERRGKTSHGLSRIAWLETQRFDPTARPRRVESSATRDMWDGAGALGYLTLDAICSDLLEHPPAEARLVVARRTFPTGGLGYWVRRLANGGLVALLTATSPRRLPPPAGGKLLTGTNPLAIGIPSSESDPVVVDVSMGAVTHGDVLSGAARPEDLVPFGGPSAHKAFALAVGLQLVVASLAGDEHGAVLFVARPEHDPVPAFRELATGVRLPGDS